MYLISFIIIVFIVMSILMYLDANKKNSKYVENPILEKYRSKNSNNEKNKGKNGYVALKLSEYDYGKLGVVADEKTVDLITDAILNKYDVIYIPSKIHSKLIDDYKKYLQSEIYFDYVQQLKLKARSLEKEGYINEAIKTCLEIFDFCYNRDISINRYFYDIDRALIMYRKTKNYEKEIELLNILIERLPFNKESWENMLEKSLKRINKLK